MIDLDHHSKYRYGINKLY